MTRAKRQIGAISPGMIALKGKDSDMRDAIELHLLAQHGEEWVKSLGRLFRRLHKLLRWAGAAFATDGIRRAG